MDRLKFSKKNVIIITVLSILLIRSSAWLVTKPTLTNLCRMGMYCVAVIYGGLLIRDRKPVPMVLLVLLFYALLGVSTLLGSRDDVSYLSYAFQGISLTIFFQYYLNRDAYRLAHLIRNYMIVLVVLNVAEQVFFPAGHEIRSGSQTYIMFLLGSRISFLPPYMLCLFLCFLCEILDYGRICFTRGTILMIVVTIVSMLIFQVATGLIALGVMILLLACCRRRFRRFCDYWILMLVFAAAYLLIVVLTRADFLAGVLDVFGKDMTFNNRSYIWASALVQISRSPLIGHGISQSGGFAIDYGNQFSFFNGELRPAHNQILHVLFEGGALALAVYITMLLHLGRAVKRCAHKDLVLLASVTIFAFNLASITEIQSQRGWMFILFVFVSNLGKFNDLLTEAENEDDDADEELTLEGMENVE